MAFLQAHLWRTMAAAILLIFLGCFIFLVVPYASLIFEKYSVLNEQSRQITLMGNWQERLADLERKQNLLTDGMQSMFINLADENEFSKVVEEIFDYAGSSSVSIRKIRPFSEQQEEKYIKRNIRLQVQGQYHNVAKFINKVEQGSYLIIVKAFNGKREVESPAMISTIDLEITLMEKEG